MLRTFLVEDEVIIRENISEWFPGKNMDLNW